MVRRDFRGLVINYLELEGHFKVGSFDEADHWYNGVWVDRLQPAHAVLTIDDEAGTRLALLRFKPKLSNYPIALDCNTPAINDGTAVREIGKYAEYIARR